MKIYLISLVTLFLFSWNLLAQQDDILPQTLVFKLKEEYRAQTQPGEINLQAFQDLKQQISASVQKIFPHHTPEYREGFADLSLIYQLNYTANLTENEVIRKLQKLKIAQYIEPYYLPKLCYTPSDTVLPSQWHIPMIDALNAWTTQKGDSNIVVGITDTGWDPTHPDLVGSIKKNYNDPINGLDDDNDGYTDNYLGWDLGSNDNNALWESTGHGVNVTGLAAATTDNITGVAGVGFNTMFLPVKISNSAGVLTHAYQGVVYAADHGCDIINCSWGSFSASQFNQDVIDYAVINKGCLVVAAVGNNNMDVKFYPAAYQGVLSVAATEQSDLKKNNSNYGYYVDVSAPGEFMWTTTVNGMYSTNGGTSMASPVVAGAVAIFKAQFPAYTNQQIGALVQATADDLNGLNPGYVDQLGTGRVNLFNGVNATNPLFLELTSHTETDNNNDVFEFGDTLRISALFTNYLDPLSGITVNVTSSSPYVNVLDGNTSLPALTTLQTFTNTADPFVVEILSGVPYNEEVTFKAVLTNGTYTNNEYFTITLNPDYINLEENLVATSITSKGKIGYNDINNSVGLGFTYNANQMLYEAGLLIGDGITRVADVVRGTSGPDQDFSSVQNVQFHPPYVSAKDLYGVMNDATMTTIMDIEVKQYSYSFAAAPDDKYVIIQYWITNTGSGTLSNVYAGLFADWDIDNAMLNESGYDSTRKLGWVRSLDVDSAYAGIKVLSYTAANNYSLDLDGSNGIDPNGAGYTTEEKYNSLSTTKNTAGMPGGADVAHVVSSGPFTIASGDSVEVAFAILAGDSLLDLQASAYAAQTMYDLMVGVEELANDQQDFRISPNPTSGLIRISTEEPIESVVVRNLLGEVVFTSTQAQLDLSAYPNGLYLLEVNRQPAGKVMVVH